MEENLLMFIADLQPVWKILSIVILLSGLLYLSNQEKKTAKFAVQLCGGKKSFAVAEVQKNTANVPQICSFGPHITILRNLRLRNRV